MVQVQVQVQVMVQVQVINLVYLFKKVEAFITIRPLSKEQHEQRETIKDYVDQLEDCGYDGHLDLLATAGEAVTKTLINGGDSIKLIYAMSTGLKNLIESGEDIDQFDVEVANEIARRLYLFNLSN